MTIQDLHSSLREEGSRLRLCGAHLHFAECQPRMPLRAHPHLRHRILTSAPSLCTPATAYPATAEQWQRRRMVMAPIKR